MRSEVEGNGGRRSARTPGVGETVMADAKQPSGLREGRKLGPSVGVTEAALLFIAPSVPGVGNGGVFFWTERP